MDDLGETKTTDKRASKRGTGSDLAPSHSTTPKPPRVTNSELALQVTSDSIARQKALYEAHLGRGTWAANHTPLVELGEIAALHRRLRAPEARDLVVKTYYQVDSRAFRIAQELFVAPAYAVVPGDLRSAVKTHNPSVISKADDPTAHSLAGLLYSRVPEQLAVKMGWLEPRKRTAREVIVDCNTPQVVTLAKYVGECLRPLGNRAPSKPNSIVLVVGHASRATRERFAPIFKELGITHPPDALGTIWYTRQAVASAKRDPSVFPPQRIVQCFTNSFDALRKTYEEANQYTREKSEIASLQNEWRHFSRATLRGWISVDTLQKRLDTCATDQAKAKTIDEATEVNKRITDAYAALLERSLRHFEGSLHREKRAVFNRLASMKAKLDASSSGRINPSPISLRAEANDALQQLRAEDIRIKESYNQNDQGLIQEQIKRDSECLRSTAVALRNNALLFSSSESVFTDKSLTESDRAREAARVFGKLGISRAALEEIKLRPFTTYRGRILTCVDSFESHLRPGHFSRAADSLAAMFFVCRVFAAQRVIEELKVSLVRSDSDLSRELQSAKSRLHALVTMGPLFNTPRGIERTAANTELSQLVTTILDTVTSLQIDHLEILRREVLDNQGVALEMERAECRKKALNALKDFDPEQFLKGLAIR